MSALQPLCNWFGINPAKLTKEKFILLEVELFARICAELKEVLRKHYREYFRILKFTLVEENKMLDLNFISLLVKDILSSGEYNSLGIANYTDTHEEIIESV